MKNNITKHDGNLKVGDLVVNKYSEYLPTIHSVSYIHGEKLRLKGHDFNHVYVATSFRLATSEEIKAGYRLEAERHEEDLWNYRQADVDQQKLLTIDSELHLDAAKEEIERLRGMVDKALNLINNWWHPNVDQKLFIEDVSKALKGHDQYAEHRTKAEQQINNGARLTKHQIDL